MLQKRLAFHVSVVTCALVSVMCVDLCVCVSHHVVTRGDAVVEIYRNRQNGVCCMSVYGSGGFHKKKKNC